MNYKTISCETSESILTITLNRPEKLNAFNLEMSQEIISALDLAYADDRVRAIIFTGQGNVFCAGADLVKREDSFGHIASSNQRDIGGLVALKIFDSNKPVIAAINGHAVGVGLTMTLPMDVRISTSDLKFGFVFSRIGIVPESCSSWFLPRLVGISKALEWTYSGQTFNEIEALKFGLISEIHEKDELIFNARKIAKKFIEGTSAVSVALVRQMFWKMLCANNPMEAHLMESKFIQHVGNLPDAKEGVKAFFEKRRPNFSNRPSVDMPDLSSI